MIAAEPSSLVPASYLNCASCLLPERPAPPAVRFHPEALQLAAPAEEGTDGRLHQRLTPAEARVLPLVLAGLADKEIACALGRAVPTVKHQVGAILRKHRVSSRARLLAVRREGAAGKAEPDWLRRFGT